MATQLYYVEDMESGWQWVNAGSEEEAALVAAKSFDEGSTVVYSHESSRGYPVTWFRVFDSDGVNVDDYQVTAERYLPGIDEPDPEPVEEAALAFKA